VISKPRIIGLELLHPYRTVIPDSSAMVCLL